MTDLAVYESGALAMNAPLPARAGVPGTQDFDSWVNVVVQVVKLADTICDTPFVPDGMRGSAPAVAAAMLAGREMGLGPMTSLANLDVIKGRPSQKPVLMRAMILSRGHKWVDVEVSDVRVIIRGCRKGESEWTEVSFTQAHAKLAGIDLGRYPADKLYARATSRLARRKFADVIMGMPYSDDEIEDGVTEDGDVAESAAAPAAIEPPKPAARTAQRRQPKQQAADNPSPAPSAGGSEGATRDRQPPAPAATAPSGQPSPPAGPPLPGEDEPNETDYDSPGTATRGPHGQLTAMWACLQSDFAFKSDEKEQARAVCEHIISRRLTGGTTGNLSFNEARVVLDTLANWRAVAEAEEQSPRDVLIAAMAAGESDG